jgi:hypothetical protein
MSIDHTPNHGGFRIDLDTQRRIEAHARAARITPGELIRMAFEQVVRRGPAKLSARKVLEEKSARCQSTGCGI